MSERVIAKVTGIRCPKCGLRITSIQELKHVLPLGLALFGNCPNCDTQVSASELWRKNKLEKESKNE